MTKTTKYKPVIIIGAPRSGTNMLRNVLVRLPGAATWPCDEINYIWRYGNKAVPHEEITAREATDGVIKFIRGSFESLAHKHNLNFVIEKTCANSLRVPFVYKIFPEAKYLYIVRNGFDATASAMKRWQYKMKLPEIVYLLKKTRFVPFSDLPYYATKFIKNRINSIITKKESLLIWGPRFAGIDDIVHSKTLAESCALQWKHCVSKSDRAFSEIRDIDYKLIRYEEFVLSPKPQLEKICQFLDVPHDAVDLKNIVRLVTSSNINKYKEDLDQESYDLIKSIIAPLWEKHDHAVPK